MSRRGNAEDWADKSIQIPFNQSVAAVDPAFVKYPAGKWDVSNPHPGYGIDPNILNEFGHTVYPKWVGNVIVNNEAEEKALKGEAPSDPNWK